MSKESSIHTLWEQGYTRKQIASILGCDYMVVWRLSRNWKKKEGVFYKRSISQLHTRVGSRIALYCVENDIGIKMFSNRTGIHHTVLSRLMKGEQDIRLSDLDKLAKGMKTTVSELTKE